jgi:hypothetical protein
MLVFFIAYSRAYRGIFSCDEHDGRSARDLSSRSEHKLNSSTRTFGGRNQRGEKNGCAARESGTGVAKPACGLVGRDARHRRVAASQERSESLTRRHIDTA